jgi:hypothetical protein
VIEKTRDEELRRDRAELEELATHYEAMLRAVRIRLATVNDRLAKATAGLETAILGSDTEQ